MTPRELWIADLERTLGATYFITSYAEFQALLQRNATLVRLCATRDGGTPQ